jgi:hypothetical protein
VPNGLVLAISNFFSSLGIHEKAINFALLFLESPAANAAGQF